MNLFSQNGTQLLEALSFTRTLFAFDFDGTLSKIVKHPDKATITKMTLNLIKKLSKIAPVAVISGRSLTDLKDRFSGFSGLLVGNHGLEGIDFAEQKGSVFRDSCEAWKKDLNRHFKQKSDVLWGIEIEDKIYSIAIHYRKSRQKKIAKAVILESLSGLVPPPRIIMGKCVVNLVPAGGPHKGIALLELMLKTDTKTAFYIGDDDTDEDVFALADPGIFTVRVGRKSQSQAKFYIQKQSDINLLLNTILGFLEKNKSKLKISEDAEYAIRRQQ